MLTPDLYACNKNPSSHLVWPVILCMVYIQRIQYVCIVRLSSAFFRRRLEGMMTPTTRNENYPLSFRVPAKQVDEIDSAVTRERRKRRTDLLEAIWNVAWTHYQQSGSLEAYAEGTRTTKRTKRVSEELQDQLYMALETILDRAPSAVIEEVARKLTQWAGKYGDEK